MDEYVPRWFRDTAQFDPGRIHRTYQKLFTLAAERRRQGAEGPSAQPELGSRSAEEFPYKVPGTRRRHRLPLTVVQVFQHESHGDTEARSEEACTQTGKERRESVLPSRSLHPTAAP